MSMAASQASERQGIGGKGREHPGAEQDEDKVEHGRSLQCGALRCAFGPSGFHSEWRGRHKDFIKRGGFRVLQGPKRGDGAVTALLRRGDMAVPMRNNATTEKLTAACEHVLRHAVHPEDVTVRSIVALAGTNVSAVSYHFGSLERLIFSVAQRAYLQLNAERLALLQAAVQRARPSPRRRGS